MIMLCTSSVFSSFQNIFPLKHFVHGGQEKTPQK